LIEPSKKDEIEKPSSNAEPISESPKTKQRWVSDSSFQATVDSDDDKQPDPESQATIYSEDDEQPKSAEGLKEDENPKSWLDTRVTFYRSKEKEHVPENDYKPDRSSPFNFNCSEVSIFLCSMKELQEHILYLARLFEKDLDLILDPLRRVFSTYFRQLSLDPDFSLSEQKDITYFIDNYEETLLRDVIRHLSGQKVVLPFHYQQEVLRKSLGDKLVDFLLGGNAFSNLCRDISMIAGPKQLDTRQLVQRLKKCYEERLAISGAGSEIEKNRLRQLCRKLQRTSAPSIRVQLEIVSLKARIQRWLELKTKSTWDWWPLNQPLHSGSLGRVWIFQWSCVSFVLPCYNDATK
jgi:hypothetical protein